MTYHWLILGHVTMAIGNVSRDMYNLAVLDLARDTTARDQSKVESGKTEGMKETLPVFIFVNSE